MAKLEDKKVRCLTRCVVNYVIMIKNAEPSWKYCARERKYKYASVEYDVVSLQSSFYILVKNAVIYRPSLTPSSPSAVGTVLQGARN